MPPTQTSEKDDYDRTDSYRVAVTPVVPDDGRSSDGRPKSRRRRPPPSKASSKSLSVIAEEIEAMKDQILMSDHKIPLDEFYASYGTDPNMGLTLPRVEEVQRVYGLNKKTFEAKTPEWVKLAKNLIGGFSLILWVGCCLSLITYSIQSDIMETPPYENLVFGILLGIVVIVTGIFSFYQELKWEHLLSSLKVEETEYATVIREGKRQFIDVPMLVIGDVIEVKAGERIPADIRIIHANNFKVDQSNLTGIIDPQAKSSEFTHDNPLESMNLAFADTYAVEGNCKGVVVRVGDMTVGASMSHITVSLHHVDILMTDEITWWMHLFTSVAVSLALLFFIIAFIAGFHWLDAIIFLIGIIMAIIPESLVAVTLICLTITLKRLHKKNCLMKSLADVEKIGAVSAILVDKTRVITQSMPYPSHMWLDNKIIDVDNSDNQTGGAQHYRTTPTFQAISRVACLCNQAEFSAEDEESPPDMRSAVGESTDVVFLRWMEKMLGSVANVRNRNRKVCEIPFYRTGKYHLTIHETDDPNENNYILLMKGAPEEIVQRCSSFYQNGKDWQFDDTTKDAFTRAFIELANSGEKVIGFCDYKLPLNKYPPGYPFDGEEINFPTNGLRFLGLVSLAEPVRPTVPYAVEQCNSAGIRLIMVTGDHPITARAVATQAGIISPLSQTVEDIASSQNIPVEKVNPEEATAAVIHGAELKTMSPDRLNYILSTHQEVVFARTALQQKINIIEGLQRLGYFVAATGVGMLDVPAVKKSDIGIALNDRNTGVVKEAADMVILDDNFSTVVTAIEEGRLVFENLRKSISYIMASNMPEFIPYVIFLVLGVPLPLGTITILVIDMGTDMVPAISLAYEQPEKDLMKKMPRNEYNDRLLDIKIIDVMDGQIGMIQAAAGFFAYFVCMGEHGFWLSNLLYIRRKWNAVAYSDLEDSYFQEWTYEQRRHLEWMAHSAFFISIVMCQWITLIVCKTRYKSLFQQGLRNHCLNFALIFETILALFFLYCPGMDVTLRLMPIRINWWITALPYCFLIFFYDECRRFAIRRNPRGWLKREFY